LGKGEETHFIIPSSERIVKVKSNLWRNYLPEGGGDSFLQNSKGQRESGKQILTKEFNQSLHGEQTCFWSGGVVYDHLEKNCKGGGANVRIRESSAGSKELVWQTSEGRAQIKAFQEGKHKREIRLKGWGGGSSVPKKMKENRILKSARGEKPKERAVIARGKGGAQRGRSARGAQAGG